MNEIVKAILDRRSIRTFKSEQLTDSELQTIIEAGQFAPSAKNDQPRHFTVVQNKDLLGKINKTIQTVFLNSGVPFLVERAQSPNFSVFYHAPTLIIVSADPTSIAPECDSSLSLGNQFLAAYSLGIGSVWIHALRSLLDSEAGKALNQELGIPEGYKIYGSGAFGYNSGEKPQVAPRKENVVTIIK